MDANSRIFAYDDPVSFLNAELRRRKRQDHRYSLREWARQLGYRNPSYLSDVLKGRRRLRISVSTLISRELRLNEVASRYFDLTVLISQTRDLKEKRHLVKLLDALRPEEWKDATPRALEQFDLIADWHNFVLMVMPSLKDFRSDLKSISTRMRNQVPVETLEESIRLLVEMGFLKRDNSGNLTSSSDTTIVLEPKVKKMAAREYQRQMAKKAAESLEAQKSEDIEFRGTTISFQKKDMEAVRALVREFHEKIASFHAPTAGDEVYQMNSQFFRLT